MYELYKNKTAEGETKKMDVYLINVTPEIADNRKICTGSKVRINFLSFFRILDSKPFRLFEKTKNLEVHFIVNPDYYKFYVSYNIYF